MGTHWTKHRIEETNISPLVEDDNISLALMNRLKARIERRVGKSRYRGPSERRYWDQTAEPPLTPAA
jgi:hypothetical protein